MGNISTRFTFRDGKTYLTGFPEWPGVHNLNDPAYSGYDTLYIGQPTPDQGQYFIIGPSCATTDTPKISIDGGLDGVGFVAPEILPPGLHVFTYNGDRYIKTDPADTPNILATLSAAESTLLASKSGLAPKIIWVGNGQNIIYDFRDNNYQPGKDFRPANDITVNNPWTPTLILPIGDFTAREGATSNGYRITSNKPASTISVYIDGVEQKTAFSHYFTVPILFEYGPRYHYQSRLQNGQHFYDTCYLFWSINLTNTAIQTG